MGPYYRGTSNGVGAFFDLFYQYPVLMLLLGVAAIGIGVFVWLRKKSREQSDL